MKIETTELLTTIFCLYNATGLPSVSVQNAIYAIDNVVTWMSVTGDTELIRFRAFAPEVYDAYIDLVNSVRQERSLKIRGSIATKIVVNAIKLEIVSTEAFHKRMTSELKSDHEMEWFERLNSARATTDVKETLNRIFAKD